MLDTLISSKTRLKLLLRFFLNPDSKAYLRGLEQEFGESTNAIRLELNRFEDAGLIYAEKEGNKKIYRTNVDFPVFQELQNLAFKHFGIDKILDQIVNKIGDVHEVYVTGNMASGLNSRVVDILLIGENIDIQYLAKITSKVEKKIERKIRTLVYADKEIENIPTPNLLIFKSE